MARKYSKKASAKVERAMKKRKAGTLKSGRSGKKVTSRKQAIAIGLSEARAEGKKVPKKAAKEEEDGQETEVDKVAASIDLVFISSSSTRPPTSYSCYAARRGCPT